MKVGFWVFEKCLYRVSCRDLKRLKIDFTKMFSIRFGDFTQTFLYIHILLYILYYLYLYIYMFYKKVW